MTDLLDISATITGKTIPREQAKIVATLKGLALDDYNFIRGRYRAPKDDRDTDYVFAQHKTKPGEWKTYPLDALNREILKKELAHVP